MGPHDQNPSNEYPYNLAATHHHYKPGKGGWFLVLLALVVGLIVVSWATAPTRAELDARDATVTAVAATVMEMGP